VKDRKNIIMPQFVIKIVGGVWGESEVLNPVFSSSPVFPLAQQTNIIYIFLSATNDYPTNVYY